VTLWLDQLSCVRGKTGQQRQKTKQEFQPLEWHSWDIDEMRSETNGYDGAQIERKKWSQHGDRIQRDGPHNRLQDYKPPAPRKQVQRLDRLSENWGWKGLNATRWWCSNCRSYVTSDETGRIIRNGWWIGIWKETVVAYFKVRFSQYSAFLKPLIKSAAMMLLSWNK